MGKVLHEFMAVRGRWALLPLPTLWLCSTDKGTVVYKVEDSQEELPIEKVYTPGVTTIEALEDFFQIKIQL